MRTKRALAGISAALLLPLTACGDGGGSAPVAETSPAALSPAALSPATLSPATLSPATLSPVGAGGPLLTCEGLARPPSARSKADPAASAVGRPLPDLTLDCLGGGAGVTLRELRGPLVLNVWASWCKPCREELPFLTAAHTAVGDQVRFAAVAVQDVDGPAREWLSFHGVPWPSLADHGGKIRGPLRVPGPPVTLFVNSEGRLVEVHYGAFTSARQVQEAIAEHLGVT